MSSPDVMVIGAGLAGLTAASLLAREGIKVTIVDEEQDLGGRLKSPERDGFRLDTGLHSFHYGDSGIWGELNRELDLGMEFIGCDEAYLLKGKERLLVSPEAESGQGLSEKQSSLIKGLLARLMEANSGEWKKKSMEQFLAEAELNDNELARDYAGALCLSVLGKDLEKVSAGHIMFHLKEVMDPGIHVSAVSGGSGKLIEALSEKVSQDNTRIIMGSRVLRIRIERNEAMQVVTSSEEFSPRAVIYTGPVQNLPDLISGDWAEKTFVRMCRRLAPISGIAIEMGLSRSISDIKGVMIDPEEKAIGRFPSNLDPSLAPEGLQIISWLVLVDGSDLSEVKTTRLHIRRLMRLIKRQFPDITDRVKWERLRVMPAVSSSSPLASQGKEQRPKVEVKNIDNMFLAGDGIASRGLLASVAISSAMEAAQNVKELLQDD